MMREYTYIRFHIGSGERHEGKQKFPSLRAFLLALNTWNRQQPGVWQYWSEDALD